MPEYYARIQAVNLDYSVYDTDDISTIRGGSYLAFSAFETLSEMSNIETLSTNASEIIAKFEADNNSEAEKILKSMYSEISEDTRKNSSFVLAVVPKLSGKPFLQCIEELKAECRWQQYKKFSFPLPNVEATAEQECELDGVRPGFYDEQEMKWLSTQVVTKRAHGKDLRNKLYGRLLGERWKADIDKKNLQFSSNLEELCLKPEKGKLSGKIAFIHIDGNRFGNIRDIASSDEDIFRNFQNHINEKIRKPALEALLKQAVTDQDFRTVSGKVALETLLWGGDEIEFVVPAWKALEVLQIFFSETAEEQLFTFKSREGSESQLCLTHAAGVVFCNHKLPILQVRKYARQLCDIAKEDLPESATDIGEQSNKISFLNMTSFDLIKGDVRDFLDKFHKPSTAADFVIPASDLPSFTDTLTLLKNAVPRSKVFDISAWVQSGDFAKAKDTWERLSTLYPGKKDQFKILWETLAEPKGWRKWFVATDLMDFSGEA